MACKIITGETAKTTIYFVRHAEPNYDNHDDRLRELSEKGRRTGVLLRSIYPVVQADFPGSYSAGSEKNFSLFKK